MNVNFTESAAEQAKVIIAGEDPGLELRVYVQGGGCSTALAGPLWPGHQGPGMPQAASGCQVVSLP